MPSYQSITAICCILLFHLLGHHACKGQPAFESRLLSFWISDSETSLDTLCHSNYQVFVEFLPITNNMDWNQDGFQIPLSCSHIESSHIYFNNFDKSNVLTKIDTLPNFRHSGMIENQECLVKSITIFRSFSSRMKIHIPYYLLEDDVYYSNGNGISIPTQIFYKEGEYDWEEARDFPERLTLLENYKKRTARFHEPETSSPIISVRTIIKPDRISTASSNLIIQLKTLTNKPMDNAKFTLTILKIRLHLFGHLLEITRGLLNTHTRRIPFPIMRLFRFQTFISTQKTISVKT